MRRRQTTKGRLTATYDLEQIRQLNQLADTYGVPVSAILRGLVRRALADEVLLPALMHTISTQFGDAEKVVVTR